MTRARIINGRWTRQVSPKWVKHGEWRTDIFKSTLSDSRLQECAFVLGTQTVIIPADELRRVLQGGHDHYGSAI